MAASREPLIEGAVTTPIFQSSTFESAGAKSYHDLRYIRLNNTPEPCRAASQAGGAGECRGRAGDWQWDGGDFLDAADGAGSRGSSARAELPVRRYLRSSHQRFSRARLRSRLHRCRRAGRHGARWSAKIPARSMSRRYPIRCCRFRILRRRWISRGATASYRSSTTLSRVRSTSGLPRFGFDLSIHSATKYLNGHTDIVAGAVIGRRELVERITRKLNHLGGSLDPHACFLLSRGMKTLAVRVRYQNESALKIARFLEQHPAVARVNYPGLEGHLESPSRVRVVRWLWRRAQLRARWRRRGRGELSSRTRRSRFRRRASAASRRL